MSLERTGRADADLQITLPVLGVSTTFKTNESRALEILQEAYGHWTHLMEIPALVRASPATVQVLIIDAPGSISKGSKVEYSVPAPNRMEVAGTAVEGVADSLRHRSIAQVGRCWLDDPHRLVHEVVEPLTLFLLGALDRTPLHAAAIVRGDSGIVLAGPSGVGKSTLVMAATRAAFVPLADDPVYVQVDPVLRVWGRSREVHLRPEALGYFPELKDLRPVRMPTGKTKVVVDVGGDRRFADRVGLCILRRHPGREPRLSPTTSHSAREILTANLDPGFDLFRDSIGDRVERVARLGVWVLELGDDPLAALPLLDRIAASIESSG